ncbi:MAG: D-alanyl-D-alanine carboxypeptidase family protein [Deltaproteobacteria bacterium]|nr:D-alanyl-D-alanine carboxypeptidase family protein [Deltaproteobacteria bacterium]
MDRDPATPMPGSLRDDRVRSGVARGPRGLFQRRVRAAVFGEPAFPDVELVPAEVCAARPHVIAFAAWRAMVTAAAADGLDPAPLAIHAAYRSVALQAEIWRYRLDERRARRAADGLPPLPERELERQQRLWTAKPGQSAHHTGLALDLALYHLGARAGRRTPHYAWLVDHARAFGFYPYLPEPWHWEYDPPGLVAQLADLRARLARGETPPPALLRPPDPVPIAEPAPRMLRRSM